MSIDGATIVLLCLGALGLGLVAVMIDRVNFPQKRFRPKTIKPPPQGMIRDRTGAHVELIDEVEFVKPGAVPPASPPPPAGPSTAASAAAGSAAEPTSPVEEEADR